MIKTRESIKSLKPYVPGRPIEEVKRDYGLSDVVKLASNENLYGLSEKAKQAFIDCADMLNYYPDGSCDIIRQLLADKLGINKEQLVFGTGTDEVISLIAQGFIETGDEMITGEITFGQLASAVTAMGGNVALAKMKDYSFDINGICSLISEKTKMIYFANPNNPTGTIFTDDKKIEILESVPRNVFVIFDEAYEEYVNIDGYSSSVPLINKYDNLIVLKTFSKMYGLASLRIGYGIMSGCYAKELEKIRKPFNVSIPAQYAACAAITDESFVKFCKSENIKVKNYCYKKLDSLGLPYIKSETNFIMIDCKIDSIIVFEELMKKGYIVRPGKAFNMPSYIRVTFGKMEQMKGFFDALVAILEKGLIIE